MSGQVYNPENTPISGTMPVEASAGTGKTYALSQAPFSAMRDCPWRKHFLTLTASLEDQARQALVNLYMEGSLL